MYEGLRYLVGGNRIWYTLWARVDLHDVESHLLLQMCKEHTFTSVGCEYVRTFLQTCVRVRVCVCLCVCVCKDV